MSSVWVRKEYVCHSQARNCGHLAAPLKKKWSGTWNSKTEIGFTDQKRRQTRNKREKMSPSPPDIGNEEGTLHHIKWTFDCHCKGMRSPGWCGLTPSPVLFAWSAFLCSQRCRLPWWAVIRGVKLAVNMPEQKYGSFFFLQRHSILPIFRGSWAGTNDGEQYLCKDLKVNVCYNYNYKVCFTVLYSQTEGSALLLNKTVKTNVGKKP